ncbi:Quinate/shikimate 5-dehydrogenase I delta [Marinobacterium lacunae]|uniref:Quinate/shikimate 5-dehydrogenase I delta n=1 Tax=Marinobacterium lacunae TaxID=1232683 RepID=A0A081FUX0_9GAMM|nr:saccharopine dehydrogenase NADP-binding domain-containing protein [Marinobacterium lacunae]KEA62325.1 Quinate/shikimate 5-dehydrogenase I delta [Marinobacterium lacunae]MBR9882612.1 NAD(P)-binding domain-containing protein [Oceanospirillales bacterium]
MIKLGLIGLSIAQSRAPSLHIMLGELYGRQLSYELHEPRDASPEAFRETLDTLRSQGYSGCNVTFPYKQIAVKEANHINEAVRLVGSTNTLSLGDAVDAANTDYTGFIRGYRGRLGDMPAGRVLLIGAGGVGRAVAFGVFELGATEVLVYDLNEDGARALADALNASGFKASIVTADELDAAARSADGLVNCTPVGHYKTPGNPLSPALFGGQKWAFDAVYTPLDTEFLIEADRGGLKVVSGFDLFIYQGIDAFEIFTGIEVDAGKALEMFKQKFEISSNLI